MASRSDIEAGKAHVTVYANTSPLMKGLSAISGHMKSTFAALTKFGNGMKSVGQSLFSIGSRAAAGLGAVTAALAYPIKAAGDLMETTSKFEAVFGDSADAVKQWADDYASAVGRSKSETMTGLATFQAFFSGLGIGSGEATEMSKSMQSLAVDFASFHNLQDPEAMQRFISALSGSGEVLSMYGVNIMEAALNQKLLAMGFPTISKGATEVQKVMARMAIIKESMGKQGAVGDAIKTSGSFSNQLKALTASLQNTAEAIGGALLPVVTPLVTQAASAAKSIAAWAKDNQGLIVTIAKLLVGATAVAGVVTVVGAGLMGLGSVLATIGTVGTAVIGFLSTFGVPLLAVAAAAAGVGLAIYSWVKYTESGKAALAGLMAFFAPLLQTARDTVSGIVQALQAGDIGLAARIAVKGIQLALAQGVAQISGLIGGQLGDTFGTIGKKILGGDFAGAFQTALKQMLAWGAQFAEGMVALFTVAARAATDVWKQSVVSISEGLLDASAQGGVIGTIASKILGVDMQEEDRRRARMDVEAARLGLATSGSSATEDAKAAARQQVQGMADQFTGLLDKIDLTMQGMADSAAGNLAADTAGGSSKASEAAEQLRRELADLRAQIRSGSTQDAGKTAIDTGALPTGGAQGSTAKLGNSFATFSAAAFLAGGAGSVQERIARATETSVQQQREMARKLDTQTKAIERLETVQVS